MRFKPLLAFILAGMAFGHHSFMAEYDASKRVRIEGVVARFDFTNPHAEIVLQSDAACWTIELSSPAGLLRRGVSTTSIRAGMRVKIEGYRSKDGSSRVYGLDLTLPDGKVLELNARGGK